MDSILQSQNTPVNSRAIQTNTPYSQAKETSLFSPPALSEFVSSLSLPLPFLLPLLLLLSLLLFPFFSSTRLAAQSPKKEAIPDHPRIMWLANEEAQVERLITASPQLQELHQRLLLLADTIATLAPLPRQQTGRRLLNVSRTYLKRITYLGYAYRMTGKDHYLTAARREMLTAAAFSDWNPSHYLDVAEMTTALAIGYDWLYHQLPRGEQRQIARAIWKLGLRPGKKGDGWWINTHNNWGQVCNAGTNLGAYAIYERAPKTSQALIDRGNQGVANAMSAYDPQGAYPEGASYWDYGTTFNIFLIDTEERIRQRPYPLVNEGFLRSAEFLLHVYGPGGAFNYGDGRSVPRLSTAAFWMASRQQRTDLLYWQWQNLSTALSSNKRLTASGAGQRFLPFLLIWAARQPIGEGDTTPDQLSWFGDGENPVWFARTGWEKTDAFVGMKGGMAQTNHAHMDAGAFVYDAGGYRWLYDLGAHDYHHLESRKINLWEKKQGGQRWEILRYHNLAHNTLSVNGEEHRVDGKATLSTLESKKGWTGRVRLDSIFQDGISSAIRTLHLAEDGSLSLLDEVTAVDSGRLTFTLVTIDNIEQPEPGQILLRQSDESLLLDIIRPTAARWTISSVQPPHEWELPNPGKSRLQIHLPLSPGTTTTLELSARLVTDP